MNKAEARAELSRIVAEYRQKSYDYWESRIGGEPVILAPVAESGGEYQVEIEAFWDDRKRENIRVLFSIDDGGWRAYYPMTEDFIIAKDGSFVGEPEP